MFKSYRVLALLFPNTSSKREFLTWAHQSVRLALGFVLPVILLPFILYPLVLFSLLYLFHPLSSLCLSVIRLSEQDSDQESALIL